MSTSLPSFVYAQNQQWIPQGTNSPVFRYHWHTTARSNEIMIDPQSQFHNHQPETMISHSTVAPHQASTINSINQSINAQNSQIATADISVITSKNVLLLVSLAIVLLLLVLAIVAVVICCKRCRKNGRRRLVAPKNELFSRASKSDRSLDHRCNHYSSGAEQAKAFVESLKQMLNPWLLDRSRLVIFQENKLGSGAFCNVFKGAIRGMAPLGKIHPSVISNGGSCRDCMCAVKVLPPFADDIARSDFLQEINFMKSLKYHPHLVSMLGVCIENNGNPVLLIEYCDQGDLLRFVRKRKDELIANCQSNGTGLTISDLVSFGWQISNGLEYLSAVGCVHRDVAARNVLLNSANVCKIGDFGLCRFSDHLIYTGRGGRLPLKWMAPESLRSYEYSGKSDVWSFGVLLYEVFSLGEVPYALMQTDEMRQFLESGNRLEKPEHCPAQIYSIMLKCWEYKPEKRPTFGEIHAQLTTLLEKASDQHEYVHQVPDSKHQ